MPHELVEPAKEGKPGFGSPIMITLRYQCPCDGREVIALNVVFNLDHLEVDWTQGKIVNEEIFHWTMKRMIRDMLTEIRQHTNQPKG